MSDFFIETERLLIRRLTLDDAAFILELCSEESYKEFIGDRGLKTLKDAKKYLKESPLKMYKEFGMGPFFVAKKDTLEPVGKCGLLYRKPLDIHDIGFSILDKHAGKGYGFEASGALLDYGYKTLGLKRIVGVCDPKNAASIALLTKLGMEQEGIIRLPDHNQDNLLFTPKVTEA